MQIQDSLELGGLSWKLPHQRFRFGFWVHLEEPKVEDVMRSAQVVLPSRPPWYPSGITQKSESISMDHFHIISLTWISGVSLDSRGCLNVSVAKKLLKFPLI